MPDSIQDRKWVCQVVKLGVLVWRRRFETFEMTYTSWPLVCCRSLANAPVPPISTIAAPPVVNVCASNPQLEKLSD